ncbi:MAG: SAM-dependent methyltransferase [Lactobacillus sp.]|nr:SAM-dependent methyltransferase [Lactobacillus sp.]
MDQGKLPTVSPKKLGYYADPVAQNLISSFRQYLSLHYGIWSLPDLVKARALKKLFNLKQGLELMAGNAYWSKALSEVGVKMIATDNLRWSISSKTGSQPIFPVESLNALEALEKYQDVDFILVSWSPNFGKSDLELVNAWRKLANRPKLFFIGEKEGATNSPEFWQEVKLERVPIDFPSFDFIDEEIFQVIC